MGPNSARTKLFAEHSGFRVISFRQIFDLLDVENGVSLEKRDFPVDFVAGLFVGLFSRDAVCVDDERAFLALADLSVKLRGLFEGHPDGSREVLHHGAGPQRENIDSAIGLPVVAQRTCNPSCRMFGIPQPNPRPDAFFQVADDLVGNPGVDVLLVVLCIVFLLYERLKNFIPSYWRGVVQSRPSGHSAAGLWLAPASPLTAERAVSAIGFRRGNEELKRGEKIGQNGNA